MRETWALVLMLTGAALMWVGVHGYTGSGLKGIMQTIYGAV